MNCIKKLLICLILISTFNLQADELVTSYQNFQDFQQGKFNDYTPEDQAIIQSLNQDKRYLGINDPSSTPCKYIEFLCEKIAALVGEPDRSPKQSSEIIKYGKILQQATESKHNLWQVDYYKKPLIDGSKSLSKAAITLGALSAAKLSNSDDWLSHNPDMVKSPFYQEFHDLKIAVAKHFLQTSAAHEFKASDFNYDYLTKIQSRFLNPEQVFQVVCDFYQQKQPEKAKPYIRPSA